MSDQVKLGQILTGDEERDAIHIAICPVVANEKLAPGQDIGFVGDDFVRVGQVANPIGIVDPFLNSMVFRDQQIYMLLYPNTITSLRHHWEHPAFVPSKPTKEESREWLEYFCQTKDCPDLETILAAVKGESVRGSDYFGYRLDHDYFFFSGLDAHAEIPPEFWDHIENIIGQPCTVRPSYFSCSC